MMTKKKIAEEQYNKKEIEAFWKHLEAGNNIFLTGCGGTGKSYLIRQFLKSRKHFKKSELAVTASTGIAAQNIGGKTVHKWAQLGIGLRKDFKTRRYQTPEDWLMKKLGDKSARWFWDKAVTKIRKQKIVIIDEVSMLDALTLHLLNMVLQVMRDCQKPFGGMQCILVGDFLQLEPVDRDAGFAFESSIWDELDLQTVYLKEVVRQKDKDYIEMLARVRHNRVTNEDMKMLEGRFVDDIPQDIVRILNKNEDVEAWNMQCFRLLVGPEREYRAILGGSGNGSRQESFLKQMITPTILRLKRGARIMVTANDRLERFFNGQLGVVIDMGSNSVTVKLDNGIEVEIERNIWYADKEDRYAPTFEQIPLRLAYAFTAHKSQGTTLNSAYVDCHDAFSHGQTYVALSRVTELGGLYLAPFSRRAIMASPKAVKFYENLEL